MTIAQKVRNHLQNKPYLLEALEKGIVNLSELSRQIQEELQIENMSAVKAALRRFSEELQKHKQKREEKVLQVLKLGQHGVLPCQGHRRRDHDIPRRVDNWRPRHAVFPPRSTDEGADDRPVDRCAGDAVMVVQLMGR